MKSMVTLLTCNGYIYWQGNSIISHSHRYWQLFYSYSGEATFKIEGNSIWVPEGSFLLVKPYEVHSMTKKHSDGFYSLDLKFEILDEWLLEMALKLKSRQRTDDNLAYFFRDIVEESSNGKKMSARIITSMLEVILMKLIRRENHLSDQGVHAVKVFHIDYNRLSKCVQDVIDRVEASVIPVEFLTIDELANRIGYSKKYIYKKFREETGMTINEYSTLLKIDKAKALLVDTDYSVGEIAHVLGYKSRSYFIRLFKSLAGMTPLQYRTKGYHDFSSMVTTFRYLEKIMENNEIHSV